jgi:hypothetical protein
MPVACLVLGLVVAYSERVGTRAALAACACLSAVSTFSSANGLLCWLVLPPALLAARAEGRAWARRWLPLWVVGLALCAAAYGHGYRHPDSHPSIFEALRHPLDALIYFVAFSGGPLAVGRRPMAMALVVGACALAAYTLALAYLFRFRDERGLLRRAMPWAALGAYSVGTGVLVTVGRVGWGAEQALSTRYTTFSLYLLVGLVYLLPCVYEEAARAGRVNAARVAWLGRAGVAAAVLLALAQMVVFVLVVRSSAPNWRHRLLRARACLLFIEAAPEERCLEVLYPDVLALRERAEALDRLGYLRPPLVKGGSIRDVAGDAACSDDNGRFHITAAEGGTYVVEGSARLPRRGGEAADAVLLARGPSEETQAAFALAEVGATGSPQDANWRKTLAADAFKSEPRDLLTAWAFDAEAGRAYRLCGTREPRRPE